MNNITSSFNYDWSKNKKVEIKKLTDKGRALVAIEKITAGF